VTFAATCRPEKAIVVSPRVEPERLQRPWFVFRALAMIGFTFISDLHGKDIFDQNRMANWVAASFQVIGGFLPFFVISRSAK